MSSLSRVGANAAGLLLMIVAGPAVVGLVVALNRLTKPKEEKTGPAEVAVTVEPTRTKPPPPKDEPPVRAPRRGPAASERMAVSRLPSLGPGLSGGVDVGLPELAIEPVKGAADAILGDLGDVVHTESSVDRKPILRFKTPIEPPAEARSKNLSGSVLVNMLIGADGTVKAVRVLKSEPPGIFDDCVVQAVRAWTFDPALFKSQPVEMWATLPVQFTP